MHRISKDVIDVTVARAVATAVAEAESSLLLLPGQGVMGSASRVTRRRHTAHGKAGLGGPRRAALFLS